MIRFKLRYTGQASLFRGRIADTRPCSQTSTLGDWSCAADARTRTPCTDRSARILRTRSHTGSHRIHRPPHSDTRNSHTQCKVRRTAKADDHPGRWSSSHRRCSPPVWVPRVAWSHMGIHRIFLPPHWDTGNSHSLGRGRRTAKAEGHGCWPSSHRRYSPRALVQRVARTR